MLVVIRICDESVWVSALNPSDLHLSHRRRLNSPDGRAAWEHVLEPTTIDPRNHFGGLVDEK